MWPHLSNINSTIANKIRSRADTIQSSKLNVWMRVFAGAGSGLILTSTNNFELFKAAGQGASVYGSPTSVGTIGYNWFGAPIAGGNDRGLRPSPGIISFEVKEGKDQISKEATLGIKCFSLEQMEAIQKYFLEPGYTICVEWGWNSDKGGMHMMDAAGPANIVKQATERNLNYDTLNKLRVDSGGEYDTFFGFIVGGNVTNEGEQFNVTVKLRGAPGLPTYLQSQQHIQLKDKPGGIINNYGQAEKVPPYEPELLDKTNKDTNARPWNNMYNQLPSHRQIQHVVSYATSTSAYDFINMDKAVTDAMVTDSNGGFWSFDRPLFGAQGSGPTIKVAGQDIPKEKLWSPHNYITMDLAVEILNRNGGLDEYKFGDKSVKARINIKTAAIGAFRYMFSTKSSALIIPGELPDFRQYFWNRGEITQKGKGVLGVSGLPDAPTIDNSINKRSFVQSTSLNINTPNKKIKEAPYFWGYLRNLYVNFDMFVEKLNQPNKTIREVLLDILNEMSSAVNNFWNFQLVETQADADNKALGITKGDIIITVVDENWVGNRTEPNDEYFFHNGNLCPFLESTLDLSIPSEMANQIVSQRLGRATQPSMPYLSTGGFFTSEADLFSKDPKLLAKPLTAKQIADAAAAAQLAALAAKPLSPQDAAKQKLRLAKDSRKNIDTNLAQLNADIQNTPAGPIKDQLKADYKILWDAGVQLDKDIEKAKIDSEKAFQDTVAAKKSQISSNLAKIEIVPNPELGSSIPENMTSEDGLNDPTTFHERFRIYTFDDTSFLDRIKNDYFAKKGGLSHPLPIHYTFKTLGISGVRFGDTFKIVGIPDKYAKNGIFQVQQIEHSLTDMLWTTTITGAFRALQT